MVNFAKAALANDKISKVEKYKAEIARNNQYTKKIFQHSNFDISVLEEAEQNEKKPIVFTAQDHKMADMLLN